MTQIARGSGDRWTTKDAELARQLRRAGGRAPTEPWGDSAFDIADWRAFRASALLVAGDLPEARDEANMALSIPEIGSVARARALSARGTAKVSMSGHAEGSADLRESLELIRSVGAHNTTLHAGVLTNLAMSYAAFRDRRARRTLAKAAKVRAAAAASDADWAREVECLEAFNAVLVRQSQMRAEELIDQLSAIARTSARVGVPRVEGLARAEVATILSRSEQYTSSLFFSERARAAFEEAGFDALAVGAQVARAHVLQGLGMDVTDELGAILTYKGSRSSLLLQRLAAHSVYAEHLAHLGEIAGSVAHYRRANDIGLRLRSRGLIAPALAERIGVAMGGLYRARAAGMDTLPWIQAFQTLKDDVVGAGWDEQQTVMLDLSIAMASMDAKQVAALMPTLEQAVERMPAALATDKLDGARYQATSFARPPSLEADLQEYLDHIRHLVGEQEEEVRVSYRNANLVPVLNRILWTRGDSITPWSQFRLVEYSRWGSLPPRDIRDRATDAKSVAEAALRAEGRTFPTSMHDEGPRKDARFAALDLSLEDFLGIAHDAVAGCGWVGQLYLSGSRLAWAGLEVSSGRVLNGRRQLDGATSRALRLAPYWIAPNTGPDEVSFLTANGLGPEYATTLAAARVATGPFVQDHRLARDYLLGLPRRCHAQARYWLKTREVPDFDFLCEGLGGIFDGLPDTLSTDDAPIAMSVAGHLRGVPIALAQIAGRPLGCRRPVVTLPPLSVLSYAKPTTHGHADSFEKGLAEGPTSDSAPWHLTRLGNVGLSSGFAPRSEATQIIQALTASQTRKHAVLYSGHIARGTITGASSAGIPLGGGAHLTAAELLRAERLQVPARVGIVGCEGAGWNLSDEWGGLAAALLLRGTEDVVASDWTILDTASTPHFDDGVADLLVQDVALETGVMQLMQKAFDDWSQDRSATPPQLWASLRVMRR